MAHVIGTSSLSTIVLLLSLSFAWAHGGATGIVKVRMDSMKSIGAEMKKMAQMIQGKSTFDAKVGAVSAREISGHGEKVPQLFPKNSNPNPSEALNAIWENWQDFESQGRQLVAAAEALAAKFEKAETAKEVSSEFRVLAGTCKSCHQTYRKKKS
jgi:cytochrome c556